jgi:hypothetical protein
MLAIPLVKLFWITTPSLIFVASSGLIVAIVEPIASPRTSKAFANF